MITLTEDNIQEWKEKLDRLMKDLGGAGDFSESLDDWQWLKDYSGMSAEEVVYAELSLYGTDG